jgi:D-alanyl-lipoteichoic acid acyltransferase DltB (MBOAT superfamily)
MAIGLARLFNLRFPLNFNSPYQAQSVIDYWQRWHMTLTRWLMMYLYNPLALHISRRRAAHGLPIDRAARSTLRGFGTMVALPTVVTIGLAGVWHGSAFTFVVFGLLHGGYLCVNHAWRLLRPGPRSGARHAAVARVALTYGCVLVGSVMFRATSLADAGALLRGMLGLHGLSPAAPDLRAVVDVLWLVMLYVIVWGAPNTQQIMRTYAPALGRVAAGAWPRLVWQPTLPWAVAFGAAATLGLLSIGGTGEFLYYRF